MKLLVCTQVVDENHPILGFFHGWLEEFAKHFSEVHVICLQKGEHHLPQNVFVYSLGKEKGENKLKYLYRFYKYFGYIFFKVRVNYVFFHMGVIHNILGAPFFLIRKFYNTKFYWWKTHGTVTIFGKIALLFVDRVYTASVGSFPLTTSKKVVVGHAIDTHDVATSISSKQNPPIILFVGRVTPVKKVEYVIKTAQELVKRSVAFRVRIVGLLADTKYEAQLRSLIDDLKLENIIEIVGPKKPSELKAEYEQASVVINPSETGGIDKVVLEAMKFGLPVVALEETYGGLLHKFNLGVAKQDAVLYADCIEKIVSEPAYVSSISGALRHEVVTNHALSTLTYRIFNI